MNANMTNEEKFELVKKLAKEMILTYVEEKYKNKISATELEKIIDNTKITEMDISEEDHGEGGAYIPLTGEIKLKMDRIKKFNMPIATMETTNTLMHEFQHKFSHELAKGEAPGEIEEGFSDLFAAKCIQNYIDEHSKELSKFGFEKNDINQIIEKSEDITVYASDYYGEAEFIRSSLEIIRQKSGNKKTEEAEFEYTFGDKKAFEKICEENLGKEYINILNEMKSVKGVYRNRKFNRKYIKMLQETIKDIPIKDEKNNGKNTNIYLQRQEITKDIIKYQELKSKLEKAGINPLSLKPDQFNQFEEIYNKMEREIAKFHLKGNVTGDFLENIKEGYIKNCITLEDIEKIQKLRAFKHRGVENIIRNENIDIKDVLKSISGNTEKINNQEFQKRIIKDKENLKEISAKELTTIIDILYNTQNVNKEVLEIIEGIEKELTTKEQIKLELTKNKLGKEINSEYIKNLLSKTLSKEAGKIETDNKENGILLKDFEEVIKRYYNNEPRKDENGLKEILDKLNEFDLQNPQKSENDFRNLSYNIAKEEYFNTIKQDLKREEIYSEDIREKGIETIIEQMKKSKLEIINTQKYFDITKDNSIADLRSQSNILEFYTPENIEKRLEKVGFYNEIKSSYEKLDEKEKEIFLNTAINKYDLANDKQLDKIENMIESLEIIANSDEIINQNLKVKYAQLIEKRENPIADSMKICLEEKQRKEELPRGLEFIKEEELASIEKIINEKQRMNKIPDKSIETLLKYEKNENDNLFLQKLSTISKELLKNKYEQENMTTTNFIENKLKTCDTEIMEDLSKIYLESIGKSNSEIELKALTKLGSLSKSNDERIVSPQYISYVENGKNVGLAINNEKDNFQLVPLDGQKVKVSTEFKERQNKKKKGIFSIFKSRKAKEMVEYSALIEETEKESSFEDFFEQNTIEQKEIKVLNRYESGRIEFVTLDKEKGKVISKEELEPKTIGNDGALLITKDIRARNKVYANYKTILSRENDNDKVQNKNIENEL